MQQAVSNAALVLGTLFVFCPDELANELRPQVYALYPGVCLSEFSSDEQTIFGVSDVPYPMEQARYALANLCSSYSGRAWVCWSWVPQKGTKVLPGGTLSVKCYQETVPVFRQAMPQLFPGTFVYEFAGPDGWVSFDVDMPCPDSNWAYQFAARVYMVRHRSGGQQGYVSWSWRPWFDEEEA